jgi:hypothetical protein
VEGSISGVLHSCRRPQIEFQLSGLDDRKIRGTNIRGTLQNKTKKRGDYAPRCC